jgi:hypothetical protein
MGHDVRVCLCGCLVQSDRMRSTSTAFPEAYTNLYIHGVGYENESSFAGNFKSLGTDHQ